MCVDMLMVKGSKHDLQQRPAFNLQAQLEPHGFSIPRPIGSLGTSYGLPLDLFSRSARIPSEVPVMPVRQRRSRRQQERQQQKEEERQRAAPWYSRGLLAISNAVWGAKPAAAAQEEETRSAAGSD